jgi:hypothetical protein
MASRCLGLGLIVAGVLVPLSGCMSPAAGSTALPKSLDTPLNLAALEPEQAHVARSQRPELDRPAPPPAAQIMQAAAAPGGPPGLPTPPALPTPPSAVAEQGQGPEARPRLTVRALVNHEPIFDDEVMTAVLRHGDEIMNTPPEERAQVIARIFKQELNQLVERELIVQDALHKLEKNPKFLQKLKEASVKEFDKKMRDRARQLKMTVEDLKRKVGKQNWHNLARQEERNFIAQEYIRSRIYPHMQEEVTHALIREVYDRHPEQFRTVDKVQWQDIFIMVGPNHPTMADARRFAEQVLAGVRGGQKFDDFLRFDEGDSWLFRKGEGNGQRRGEIKPPELERYLFDMGLRDGQIGPVVELSTGVHVFRLLKREHAGQLPFDEKVQKRISDQLKSKIAEREYKQVIKELRERAFIEIVPGNPTTISEAR